MATVDEVIVSFEAKLDRYNADVRNSTSLFQTSMAKQGHSIANLQRDIQRSSGQISGTLKGLAGSIASYFTGRELIGMLDSFTRFQNQLKVAGLQGQNLASVQENLLALSTKYGVNLEALGGLYGKSSQAAQELGASQSQILKLTEATSQSLLITGTSSQAASGAILGLSQALASGTVRAEEFNQINEGGLRPLLEAAAASERFGGSVAKLRTAVLDGKLSSQEFFTAIQSGSAMLETKAANATLTLSGAFEALSSQLIVYFGTASQANGITAAFASAIGALADNLDTIIPALAIIATAIGGRFVAGALAGGMALRTISAYASIATTSLAGTALAARGAGAALLGAFGGPVGLAITAVAVSIGYLATRTGEAADAAHAAETQAIRTAAAQDAERRATELLAQSKGKERAANIAATIASRDRAAQALQTAKALQTEAKAAIAAARAQASKTFEKSAGDNSFLANFGRALGGAGGAGPTITPGTGRSLNIDRKVNAAQAAYNQSDKKLAALEGEVDGLSAAINAAQAPVKLAPASNDKTKPKKDRKSKGPTGPTRAELDARADAEQNRLDQDILQAKRMLASNAAERADFELEAIALEREQRLADIAGNKDLTAAQRKAQEAVIAELFGEASLIGANGEIITQGRAGLIQQQVVRESNNQILREQNDLLQEQLGGEVDALRGQYDMARSQKDRRAIALKIIDLEYRSLLADNDNALAAEGIADYKRQELEAARANLVAEQQRRVDSANIEHFGPGAQFLDDLRTKAANTNEELENLAVGGLRSLSDGIGDAIVSGGDLGDVLEDSFKRVISQVVSLAFELAVIKPLMESLFSGGSSGTGLVDINGKPIGGGGLLGGIGSFLGSLIGNKKFASGTNYAPGGLSLIGERGPELMNVPRGAQIIPNNTLRAMAGGGGGGVSTIRLELSGDVEARMVDIATGVSVEVVKVVSPTIRDMAVAETIRRGSRPRT